MFRLLVAFSFFVVFAHILSAAEIPQIPSAPMQKPAIDPETDPAYLLDLAELNFRHGVFERVEPLLKKAMEKATPEQKLQASRMLADLALQKHDFAGAAKAMEQALEGMPQGPDRVRAGLRLADLYQQAKNPDDAEKLLTDLNKQLSSMKNVEKWMSAEVQRRMLQLWAATPAKLDAFLNETEAAVAANPKDEASLEHLYEVYVAYRPDTVKAVDAAEKLAALHPNDAGLAARLVNAYCQNKQFDKAIDLVKQRLAGAPAYQARQEAAQIGRILLQANKKDEAVAWMKEHFEKADATADDLNQLGNFYSSAHMPKASEEAFAKAIPLGRTPAEKANFLVRIASSAISRKDAAKAEATVQTLEKDFATDPLAQAQVKMLRSRLQALAAQPKPATPPAAQPIQSNVQPQPQPVAQQPATK